MAPGRSRRAESLARSRRAATRHLASRARAHSQPYARSTPRRDLASRCKAVRLLRIARHSGGMTCLLDTGRGDETFVRCCDGRRCSGFREGGEIRHPHRGELARNPRLAGECFPLRGESARVPGPRFTPAYAVSTRKRTPRVPCRRSIQQLAIAGAPLSATASEHSDWAAGPEAARIVATCSRGVWAQSTHARSYASDRTWASGRAGNPSPPEGRGIGDAKDRPGSSAFRRSAHPSCHRPHSITAVCARLDELAVVRDADQWTRVTGKEDDGAGAEDGIDGAPLETELREIRARQDSIGVFSRKAPSTRREPTRRTASTATSSTTCSRPHARWGSAERFSAATSGACGRDLSTAAPTK
jgi:hypothetical protein